MLLTYYTFRILLVLSKDPKDLLTLRKVYNSDLCFSVVLPNVIVRILGGGGKHHEFAKNHLCLLGCLDSVQ